MSVGENLLRYKKDQVYCGYDDETANLNLLHINLPFQVSWILFTQKEVLETHNYYLNWGGKLKMSKDAARITRYDEDLVKREGKDPKEIYLKFRSVQDNKDILLVAHSGLAFDNQVNKIWCEAVGEINRWDYLQRYYDTSLNAKAIKENIKFDANNKLAWYFKLNSLVKKGLKTNLALLAREYGINQDENSGYHDSAFDINIMKQVFLKQLWELEIS